jgi:hypothetical protein
VAPEVAECVDGPRWGCVSQHRKSRFVVAWKAGASEEAAAPEVVRRNGVLRDRLGCLSRKTHAFAKRGATWDAAVGLSLFEENWMRAHQALRVEQAGLPEKRRYLQRSPAMALGLTDHVWSWVEFLTRPAHN